MYLQELESAVHTLNLECLGFYFPIELIPDVLVFFKI